jgi:hypothetical protein
MKRWHELSARTDPAHGSARRESSVRLRGTTHAVAIGQGVTVAASATLIATATVPQTRGAATERTGHLSQCAKVGSVN